ncbi:sodium-dependent phosphate transport protein 3-like isoform X3 [Vombatus ursinus]|uniref:sodium-dependent phosphate transport protein 3-like isoform X3 n=1 Tax=Vombatus ursinus TaxID=29139 RepID=UPI000FFD6E93|nr:sodium-dependent phosphate transport protein 3-like isoform X3 [Vombatus ursinus]
MEDDSLATEIHEESTCPLLDEQFPRGKGPGLCSVRWGLALILHISLFVTYSQRVDLSIAIVAMVNSTGQQKSFNVSADVCPGQTPAPLNTSQPREVKAPVYDWTPETCGLLLSSFSYGYLVTQVPGGYLTGIVGWKPVLGIGLLLSSVLGLLLPSAAELGVIYLALVQAFRGLSQEVIFPAVYTLWTKWAPPQELTCLMNVADAGTTLGTFFTLMVGGITCQTLGWPACFYIFGGVHCVWCLLWFFLVFEDPDSHPCISTTEKEYITSASTQKGPCHRWSLPLLSMLKCGPLWAIAVAYFCCDWLFYTLLTLLPVYLNRILHLDSGESGFLSAPPHIGNWLGHIGTGLLGDFLVAKSLLQLATMRKLFTALGLVLKVSYVGCNYIAVVILFTLSMTLISMTGAGFAVNLLDVAPRYAGFLHGVINTLANLSGMVAPSVAGFLGSQDTLSGWRNVFFLSGAVNLCGVTFYLLFGRADIQDWARVESAP